MEKTIDIVAFTVPYPPDYGGVIDVYYRIKSLSELGYTINLHCFQYGRDRSEYLESLCKKVYYYRRRMTFLLQFSPKPFIVVSRSDNALLNNLLKNQGPIFFEGLHSTGFLKHHLLSKRMKVVRTHNVEHEYYLHLAKQEPKLLKKLYFLIEAAKLKKFEKILAFADALVAISQNDASYFQKLNPNTRFIPPFHNEEKVNILPGKGNYILYHGNLEVRENHEAALFILDKIASKINHQIILAGRSPQQSLVTKANSTGNAVLISNPSNGKMNELVAGAHINLLPTFQNTGFKLKLLHALFSGRFCIVNNKMVEGTSLEPLCSVKDNVEEMIAEIERLMKTEFNLPMIETRAKILETNYSNRFNALKLEQILKDSLP
jgi:glycosyltransferase involved in cell wall biosynthesis